MDPYARTEKKQTQVDGNKPEPGRPTKIPIPDLTVLHVAVGSEPRDFGGDDGTTRKDGADLIAHGGAIDLPEVLPNGLEGACFKTEPDDGQYAVDVFLHFCSGTELGLAGVYGVKLQGVMHINVHVAVVLVFILLDEVGEMTLLMMSAWGMDLKKLRKTRCLVTFSSCLLVFKN